MMIPDEYHAGSEDNAGSTNNNETPVNATTFGFMIENITCQLFTFNLKYTLLLYSVWYFVIPTLLRRAMIQETWMHSSDWNQTTFKTFKLYDVLVNKDNH